MKTGLLESLKKYRPREGKTPLENFITEAFAWILYQDQGFSNFFLKKLGMDDWIDYRNCEWITQYNFSGNYPDMVCLFNNKAIVFEHKLWDRLRENQIGNYREYSKRSFEKYKVVLITATKFQHEQEPDLALCWNNVYEYINEWIANSSVDNFILEDFQRLLASEGMGPSVPISYESLRYYYASINLKENISVLIRDYLEERYRKQWPDLYINKKKGLYYAEGWGRMGLNLLNTWTPGIFVGFLLDGTDHCVEPIDKFKGPDISIIIDFDKEYHDIYQHNKYYQNFVSMVSVKVTDLNEDWDFYNHLEDNDRKSVNKWHPIHIRKPAICIFEGTQRIEEQADSFYNETRKILDIIRQNAAFKLLRKEFYKSS